MSSLALEIDQTMQQLDAASAQRLERLVRDALELVRSGRGDTPRNPDLRFPLVNGAKGISSEEVAKLQDEP